MFYLCVSMCVSMWDVYRFLKCQKMTLGPLELELQTVVSHPMWVLGTKTGSFGRHRELLTAELFLQPLDVILKNSITSEHGLWSYTSFYFNPSNCSRTQNFLLTCVYHQFSDCKMRMAVQPFLCEEVQETSKSKKAHLPGSICGDQLLAKRLLCALTAPNCASGELSQESPTGRVFFGDADDLQITPPPHSYR